MFAFLMVCFSILATTIFTVIVTIILVGRMVTGSIGLHRSNRDRIVAGVAAGFAESLGVSPVLTRLIWIILFLPGGLPGFVPYLICWAMMPVGE